MYRNYIVIYKNRVKLIQNKYFQNLFKFLISKIQEKLSYPNFTILCNNMLICHSKKQMRWFQKYLKLKNIHKFQLIKKLTILIYPKDYFNNKNKIIKIYN